MSNIISTSGGDHSKDTSDPQVTPMDEDNVVLSELAQADAAAAPRNHNDISPERPSLSASSLSATLTSPGAESTLSNSTASTSPLLLPTGSAERTQNSGIYEVEDIIEWRTNIHVRVVHCFTPISLNRFK